MKLIKAARGTKDIFGSESKKFDFITEFAAETFKNYGFSKLITPIFEDTALFKRGIGEGTDIVEKEMYTFSDRGDRSLTLRPEGTASVVRHYLEHKIYGKEDLSKYFYVGQMFRYERPQAGRYREFNQLGVEVLGESSPVLDAEIIAMGYKFLLDLGIEDLEVHINSIGGNASRTKYKEVLVSYLREREEKLCSDCKTRIEKNPLRVLDCKVETCKEATSDAPKITEFLSEEETTHYNEVKKYLEIFGVKFIENHKLVRGLDYYSSTVFEIITNKLGAQGTVLAGGRYDNLLKLMGNREVPAFGFAAGVERIMMLLPKTPETKLSCYIAWLGEEVKDYSFKVAKVLRDNGFSTHIEYSKKSMKANMKKADKLGAKYGIIIGEDEMAKNEVSLKNFETREQENYTITELVDILCK